MVFASTLKKDPSHFKIISYNLALTEFLPDKEKRLSLIIDFLKKQKADLLCLQEVWQTKDREKLLRELAFPHAFYLAAKPLFSIKNPACSLGDLFGTNRPFSCALKNCILKSSSKEKKALGPCVSQHCYNSLKQIVKDNKECALALMAQSGQAFHRILFRLLWPWQTSKKANSFLYQGENGLLLLSQEPFILKKGKDFSSSLVRRGGLQVEIQKKAKRMAFFCTHLAADTRDIAPYVSLRFSSPEEEHHIQVGQLLQWVKEKASLPSLLMGDFNCSFSNPQKGLSAQFSSSCHQLTSNKYFTDIAQLFSFPCTFCSPQGLQGGNAYRLDRFYLSKNIQDIQDIQLLKARVLEPIAPQPLSDHKPIQLELKFP